MLPAHAARLGRGALDLLAPPAAIAPADVVYLCAGVNGFQRCEQDRTAYRANVDGTLAVAALARRAGAFLVWVSSDCVEWSASAYARQKSLVEVYLMAAGGAGIVRAARVTDANLDALCATLIRVGRGRLVGLTRWDGADG
jgi:dTDP-4-dehydrorhamnose reductase